MIDPKRRAGIGAGMTWPRILIPIPPYDKEVMWFPWCGLVREWPDFTKPPTNIMWCGRWHGKASAGGVISVGGGDVGIGGSILSSKPGVMGRHIISPGDVLRWGQNQRELPDGGSGPYKNSSPRRGGKVMRGGYGIILPDNTVMPMTSVAAWNWVNSQKNAADEVAMKNAELAMKKAREDMAEAVTIEQLDLAVKRLAALAKKYNDAKESDDGHDT